MPNVAVKTKFSAAWGRGWAASSLSTPFSILTKISNRHSCSWSSPIQASLRLRYAIPLSRRNTSGYGDLVPMAGRWVFPYGDATVVRASYTDYYESLAAPKSSLKSSYSDTPFVRASFLSSYQSLATPMASLQSYYSDTPFITAKFETLYQSLTVSKASFKAAYKSLPTVSARSVLKYGFTGSVSKRVTAKWFMTEDVSKSSFATYDLRAYNPLSKAHKVGYAIQSDSIQSIAGTPALYMGGRLIDISAATVSCDETSPYWIATIDLDKISDYGVLSVGDMAQISFGSELFNMVVDGKSMSRDGSGAVGLRLNLVSVLALYESPFATNVTVGYTEATDAQTVVEDQIGPVAWNLPSWQVPVEALSFTDSTPLSISRRVVEAIGGVIESNPDGSVVCRKRYPVSIPDYLTVAVSHSLWDSSILSLSENIAPNDSFNRAIITNDGGVSSQNKDTLEEADVYNLDSVSDSERVIRAYLYPSRPVTLAHTGPSSTVVVSKGEQVRTEVDTIELIEGKGSLRYNVNTMTSMEWLDADLGSLSFDGKEVSAASGGYSLVKITYTVRSVDWYVSSPLIRDIQFVLMDT